MRIISRKTIRLFYKKHSDAKSALEAWFAEAKQASWDSPNAIKATYGNASIVGNNRVVFNICGNKYRLVVLFNYAFGVGYVRFVGTHRDYDRIDVETI